MTTIIAVISAIVAVIGALISILTYFHNKRTLFTGLLIPERMEWRANLQDAVLNFAYAYLDANCTKEQLLQRKLGVEVYLNCKNSFHQPTVAALNKCYASKERDPQLLDGLMEGLQQTLTLNYTRIKSEAGFRLKDERQVERDVNAKRLYWQQTKRK